MISIVKNILLIISISLLIVGNCYADTNRKQLSKNPFDKPDYLSTATNSININFDTSYSSSEINLRATLSAGDKSLANVDGVMVFVGEKIKGYELIEVGEGSATFRKNGKELTLSISEKHEKLKWN